MSFKVQRRQCRTCIYRPGSPLDVEALEAQIADGHGGFTGWRTCHHSDDACCAGFFARHKDKFQVGQVAQRLGLVEKVDVDTLAPPPPRGMREAIVRFRELGGDVEKVHGTGEIVFTHPAIARPIRVNERKKDAPRAVTSAMRRLAKEEGI
jgi:hypothetical protein